MGLLYSRAPFWGVGENRDGDADAMAEQIGIPRPRNVIHRMVMLMNNCPCRWYLGDCLVSVV